MRLPPLRAGEGCGNTFALAAEADLRGTAWEPEAARAELARRACGARTDGLLILGEPEPGGAVPARIVNRDGSDGGACLNGLRVAACAGGAASGAFRMAGRLVPWRRAGAGEFALDLGPLREARLRPVRVGGREGTAVDFWNPHAAFMTGEVEGFPLAALAAQCDADRAAFPRGVNVEIVNDWRAAPVRARVRERGVGETRACGSGAVAIALAAWAGGREGPLEVRMPGGTLRLSRRADGAVELAGTASVSPYQEAV